MNDLRLAPGRRERLGDQLYGQLLERIVSGALKEGDLMALVRINIPTEAIEKGVDQNRAWLISVAFVTAILIMTGSYLIIRYVVVKPVKHLKAVSDAIVNNQFNVRSEIHTGDEFEDLSDAFNRMVRHLMDAQEEQKKLNTDLDHRLVAIAWLGRGRPGPSRGNHRVRA